MSIKVSRYFEHFASMFSALIHFCSRNKISCEDDGNEAMDKIPEYSLSEERQDTRRWLKVTLPSGEKRSIDMKVNRLLLNILVCIRIR